MKTARGVRQINENLLKQGRALIITDLDQDNTILEQVPNGTLQVNPKTGLISAKVEGSNSWVPCNLSEPALIIARDTQFAEELFKVVSIDINNQKFDYKKKDLTGEFRNYNDAPIKVRTDKDGNITEEWLVFELEGAYLQGRNHLVVTIDGVNTRTVVNGGIEEISEKRFAVKTTDSEGNKILCEGQELSIRYVMWMRVGGPWPRIFITDNMPEAANKDDFWLDKKAVLPTGEVEFKAFKQCNSTYYAGSGDQDKWDIVYGNALEDIIDRIKNTNERIDELDASTGNTNTGLSNRLSALDTYVKEDFKKYVDDKDAKIETALSTETTNRTNADTALSNKIGNMSFTGTSAKNETTLTGAVNKLDSAISTEKSRAMSEEARIEGKVDSETESRKKAISDEKSARESADTALDTKLTNAYKSADSALDSKISTEVTNRTNADKTLQDNINAEGAARKSADNTLQSNIGTEEAARKAADKTLQDNIDAEAQSRQTADTNLQNTLQANIDKKIDKSSLYVQDNQPTGTIAKNSIWMCTKSLQEATYIYNGTSWIQTGRVMHLRSYT